MAYKVKFYRLASEVFQGNDSFEFSYNSLRFTLLYGINPHNEEKHCLIFIKFNTQQELLLDIDGMFRVETSLPTRFKEIREFFEVPYSRNGNGFNLFNLYKDIDANIRVASKRKQNRSQVTHSYHFPNPDAIYYHGLIRHDVNGDGHNVSVGNRDKTRHLLPDLYEMIKTKNVSVRYTDERNDAFSETKTRFLQDINKHK
ncbi:DUF6037 family protein [Levilactobacillus tongjiangensis]|uniref:DUF6037 family protein n=1 Tax=Levilactobacillus tongjiangensis TaxID=2486023 RepID=A0ABW1SPH7_9LACO|nr:DUF6037 family protein [Levilactobacillus tongjiangensis]